MEVSNQPTKVDPAEVQVTPAGQMEVTPTQSSGGKAARTFMRALLRNGKGTAGALLLIFFGLVAIFAPVISPGDPTDFVSRPHQAPSAEYWFGTEGQGKDVFAQTVWGARNSLAVGFATGLLTTIIGVAIGMTAGYFGGPVRAPLAGLSAPDRDRVARLVAA